MLIPSALSAPGGIETDEGIKQHRIHQMNIDFQSEFIEE